CVGRKNYTTEQYLEIALPWLKKGVRFNFSQDTYDSFKKHVRYVVMDMSDPGQYVILKKEDETIQASLHPYYLAVAPEYFEEVARSLRDAGILDGSTGHRVIVEKPFGKDLQSAREINRTMTEIFGEANVYRIDHYLGKEMIQNIMTLRFANGMFESVWDKDHIDFVQISATETVGVENRGPYYDQAGALQDMVQNHLFQILSLIAMEAPKSLDAKDIREKQIQVLRNIEGLSKEEITQSLVLGQYVASRDHKWIAYTDEEKVAKDSLTETFAALHVTLKDPNWTGVPFYIRSGKRLRQRATYVVIGFKRQHNDLFAAQNPSQDLLLIKIQPEEGIYFRFNAKKPGYGSEISRVSMDFCQSCNFDNRINTPEAYERLLDEAMSGDDTLFTSWQQVETTWQFAQVISDARNEGLIKLHPYPAGTDGPQSAHDLLMKDHRRWIDYELSEYSETLQHYPND
ncbi:MAG: glucose-6-phosphate dehydrogenase, partial [Erysipelotrichaceae bacterium]|nr:glucose-6-phosphate dehydrogenase [Erysipelotrichaceae bacterium]